MSKGARILQVILGTQPMNMRILTTKHLNGTSKHNGHRPQKLGVDEQKQDLNSNTITHSNLAIQVTKTKWEMVICS